MLKNRLLKLSVAGAAAVAGVILVFVSVGAHSNSLSTRLAGTSVVGSIAKMATVAGVSADQDVAEIENDAQAEAAELAAEQQKKAAEAAAEAAETQDEDQGDVEEVEGANNDNDNDNDNEG